MTGEQEKKLKALLRGEFLPLFVGLRNELKGLGEALKTLNAKEPPAIQKAEITNHPEPIRELVVSNLPEVQKAEIINLPKPQKEIKVEGIDLLFANLYSKFISLQNFITELTGNIGNDARNNVFKVSVQNPVEFPKSLRIDNLAEIKQPEPIEFPKSIKISNTQPEEAIPVILTSKDKRKFYEAIQQIIAGNDIDLSGVKALLADIKTAVQNIDIDADTINLNTDEIEAKLDTIISLLGGGSGDVVQEFGEANVAALTETTLASHLVPTAKTFTLRGVYAEGVENGIFRLYVNTTKIWQGRNAWTDRNVKTAIEKEVAAGDTIFLKVLNLRNQAYDFSGMFYGQEI